MISGGIAETAWAMTLRFGIVVMSLSGPRPGEASRLCVQARSFERRVRRRGVFHHHDKKTDDSKPAAVERAKLHGIVTSSEPSKAGPGTVVVQVRVRIP